MRTRAPALTHMQWHKLVHGKTLASSERCGRHLEFFHSRASHKPTIVAAPTSCGTPARPPEDGHTSTSL
eukprot:11501719-Alexandrium_andersonii.AAC.1